MNMRARIERVLGDANSGRTLVQAEPGRGNSRKGDRHRLLDEQVRVTHEGTSHEAQLINVSGGGAMIEASFEANVWDMVKLHLGENGTIDCAVKWIASGRMGLEFAHETQLDWSAEEQAVLLREVIDRTYGHARTATPPASDKDAIESTDADEGPESRRAKRHPLIWLGTLHCDRSSVPVRVRNISSSGAMVQSTEFVRVGSEAVLELSETVSVSATVGWAVGDQIGLSFHTQFDPGQLARSTPKIAPTTWVRPAYLDQSKSSPTPWDPKWQRLTIGEINEELEGFLKR